MFRSSKILRSKDTDFPISLNCFKCFCFLGEGQFGKVYSCVNLDTGKLMAMKQVRNFLKRLLLLFLFYFIKFREDLYP